MSLIDADDPVDSGAVWAKRCVPIDGAALHDEIHAALFDAEVALMDTALTMIASGATPTPQEKGGSYHPRRSPSDGELDPSLPIADLFDAIRIADPERYPAFFRLRGATYRIVLTKVSDDADQD